MRRTILYGETEKEGYLKVVGIMKTGYILGKYKTQAKTCCSILTTT